MGDRTGIEWTDATWNPVTGCTKVSPGCDRCYAETLAERFRGTPGHYFENGFDVEIRRAKLDQPLRWTKPRRVFVNSMSDLFHDEIPDSLIAEVFAVMALAPQHTFQVLTKRAGRMRSLLNRNDFCTQVCEAGHCIAHRSHLDDSIFDRGPWPLPNVWLGVSTEDQRWAEIRIPALAETPAAIRFISAEPLLGAIDLSRTVWPALDWVIVGGESGAGARPMHPKWARDIRDQCELAEVPFHFKQWGEWKPAEPDAVAARDEVYLDAATGKGTYYTHRYREGVEHLIRVGKKTAARELDGRTWDEVPE
ncbi:hypothetical protein CH255_19665 [Rhodococcus sp. 05-2255-2A2]|uniref:DUF5131 family protein n=1 Tax=unclassified Rhodococcus (in: high G+C Gram-positive bacteria) TaxID=192944 RepID=UPI000B9B3319|nr:MULTISPECIES: phage Gp37/Gp68 family protein [unclassified Rhodococcus (in: high G+C Gram-positive bacteria)]OZE03870.1 hypothetical protein CH250_22515 [Rhodococcus sp. 05-2255-3C]OZE17023.1 hypothetical protein CH255_19665 [Rhodococcus sp. 05-2255-2A2]